MIVKTRDSNISAYLQANRTEIPHRANCHHVAGTDDCRRAFLYWNLNDPMNRIGSLHHRIVGPHDPVRVDFDAFISQCVDISAQTFISMRPAEVCNPFMPALKEMLRTGPNTKASVHIGKGEIQLIIGSTKRREWYTHFDQFLDALIIGPRIGQNEPVYLIGAN